MAPESTLAAHIRSLEERLLQSDVRKSPHELDRVLADDFIEFASDGRPYDKRQVIEALQHEDVFRRSLTDFRLRLLADDVALATFCAIREDTRSAEIVRSLRSSIWRRGRNEWQVVFHQGTLHVVP
jgi:glyoxylase I family protein